MRTNRGGARFSGGRDGARRGPVRRRGALSRAVLACVLVLLAGAAHASEAPRAPAAAATSTTTPAATSAATSTTTPAATSAASADLELLEFLGSGDDEGAALRDYRRRVAQERGRARDARPGEAR